ncbi:site-specific DNA-methyltransferase [Myroides odoratimimus]|uniref:site-specific DNA-methyltransferase n=1 Tax=Myroides odoratimimus TaxID=76832 RepID=UPI003F426C46
MNTEQDITHNILAVNPNLNKLRQAFPHCFDKNGEFNFAKFKAELDSSDINIAKEGYSLDWLGKSYARVLASDAATTLLKEDEAHNAKPENANSQNLLIKGDNLEVLKHLSNAYYEKVKMIYIDPPYNTGSDGFVYNDDRKFTVQQLQDLAGISEEEAKRILEFTQSNSNSHSAWLTFMYPRLYIAKQLLKDDGVIFISIDDNEVAQLRLLMDEVFGEENFIGQITIVNNPRGRDYGGIAQMHEYILVYSKSILTEINLLNDPNKIFKYADNISGFDLRELRNRNIAFHKDNRPNLYYPFYVEPNKYLDNDLLEISLEKTPTSIELFPKESQGYCTVWRWGKEKSKENLNINIAAKKMTDGGYQIVEKYRKSDVMARSVWWDKKDNSERGTLLLKTLFDGRKIFDFPKSVDVLTRLIEMGTNSNDLILDFFAGSGSTAHSVLKVNAENIYNLNFISVQLPESIDAKKSKVAYDFVKKELGVTPPTIFEITKERIIRAAKQIKGSIATKIVDAEKEIKKLKQELPTEDTLVLIADFENKIKHWQQQDLGFKVYETTPLWDDYNFKAEQLANAQKLFDDEKLTEEDVKALFTTWKTYDGSTLTEPVQEIDLAGYKTYYTKQKLYLMHKGFSTDTLKALLEQIDSDANFNPTAIIAFGYYFESKALREIAENIKTYNNKKNIDIDFITRY